MKLRMSVGGNTLFFVSSLIFAFCVFSVIEADPTECAWDDPGYKKCREMNADCLFSGIRSNYECRCSEGYWMFEGRCQEWNWCADGEIGDMICKSNGTVCRSSEWTAESYTQLPFKCECESKYVQSGICSVNALYCQQRGAKSYRYENVTLCECESGDHFFDYSMSKCQNLDLCPFKTCTGKYEECQGSECVCKTSYRREGSVCRPRKYCDSSICGSAKCEEGPEDDPKSVRCYCDDGYVLVRKEGIPYCKLIKCESHSLNPCDHLCSYSPDMQNTYCECLPGHTLKHDNFTCEIQASNKCSYNTCNSRSICIKISGKDQCRCKNSLVREGECLDRCEANELLKDTCPDRCRSVEGGFQCICEGKYRLSKNQVTCEERRMCVEGEEGLRNCCEKNRTCVESPQKEEGYTCGDCMHGLQEYEGHCVDLCEVQENKHFCEDKGGICVSMDEVTNEVKCKCRPLLVWKKNVGCVFANHSYTGMLRIFNSYEDNRQNNSADALLYGEGDLDWKKLDHDLSKSMLALFGQALSGVNVLHCRHDQVDENHEVCIICMVELQLHFKDYGILEALNFYNVCKGGEDISSMFCFIPPYLKLVPRHPIIENVEVPFHQSKVCGFPYGFAVCPATTNCVPEGVGFSCRCSKGFVAKTTVFLNNDKTGVIEVCQDINECETRNPCPSGTICRNTMGDFECPCEPGLFRWHGSGKTKMDQCTRACLTGTCIHGQCEEHESGFYCRCNPGYSGLHCEEIIPDYHRNCFDSTSETGHVTIIAVGVVEGFVFVAFVIFAVIFHRYCKCYKPKNVKRQKVITPRTGSPQGNGIRNRTIDHIHMTSTMEPPNRDFRASVEEEPEEPIYADCTQIT